MEKLPSPGRKGIPISGGVCDAGVGLVSVSGCWLRPRGQGQSMGEEMSETGFAVRAVGKWQSTCRDSGHSLAAFA